ncbi:MAG: glycosyltransferase family 4 protein [Alphaproteobacteria bacterium]|jgi:glycosyltransferase involved in cell wall biosynthesis|nr:glycosyltransferase family 4 protein [Alphaproteobacteria bacterium]
MRIAFYAPMKPPDHPTPSGDRRMARLLMAALAEGGHEVFLASGFRSYEGGGDAERQRALAGEGAEIAEWLGRELAAAEEQPDLWFTYHLYHKAPDWLGPKIAADLEIPYVVAEASFAPKQAGGPWDLGHRAAGGAIAAADAVFCLTQLDMACVGPLLQGPDRLHYLPPFMDAAPFEAAIGARDAVRGRLAAELGLDPARPWLVTVAMMRPGDKLDSYRRLGAALDRLAAEDWSLLVVGGGEARVEVEAALAQLGHRVAYAGALAPEQVPETLAAADLYVWPATREAYGMALLEAQAAGLAVVAGAEPGVFDVVEDGRTGLLTEPGDVTAFAEALRMLLRDPARRRRLGKQGRALVGAERTLAATARRLGAVLEGLVA